MTAKRPALGSLARPLPRPLARAFTMVEILVVVVILGILSAIVIPQFSNATEDTTQTAIKQDLMRLRQQIELYRTHHNGQYPTLANFTQQMTLSSNADGQTAAVGTPGYPLGPYLPRIPDNTLVSGPALGNGAPGTSDWYYDEVTGQIAPNNSAEHRDW